MKQVMLYKHKKSVLRVLLTGYRSLLKFLLPQKSHLFILLTVNALTVTAEKPQQLKPNVPVTVPIIQKAPKIDGISSDPCWQNAAPLKVFDTEKITAKICQNQSNIFILVQFPAKAEKREHLPWHWDTITQCYKAGTEQEQAVTVIFAEKIPPGQADLWIWGACRTDPVTHADDYQLYFSPTPSATKSISLKNTIKADIGTRCWFSRFYTKFAGSKLPRFYNSTPTESAADVQAKGEWKTGIWTIEFSRKLNTGNPDDIILTGTKFIRISPQTDLTAQMHFVPVQIQ